MNLIVDCGNTNVKLALFTRGALDFYEEIKVVDFEVKMLEIFKEFPQITHAIVSSVGFLSKKSVKLISEYCQLHLLSSVSKIPFSNKYVTPKTLGVDRIALVTAAYYFSPKRNTLVIDAGTCITYDMLTEKGDYLGGAISPGVLMRYKAMNNQTSKLPLLEPELINDFVGNTTEMSMHSGVVNGICCELDGVIDQYQSRFQDLTVILTGGDAQFLSKRLKNTIFVHSKFLLEGLNNLLENNKH